MHSSRDRQQTSKALLGWKNVILPRTCAQIQEVVLPKPTDHRPHSKEQMEELGGKSVRIFEMTPTTPYKLFFPE
jgi:hypothetical protein